MEKFSLKINRFFFVDIMLIQIGGWSYNFSSSDEDVNVAIEEVSKQLVKKGVTSYCPTVITSSKDTYRKILPKIKPTQGGKENGASILGLHLEGKLSYLKIYYF